MLTQDKQGLALTALPEIAPREAPEVLLARLGPLRFETGFPLTRRSIDDPYLFEFTIGNFF